MYKIPDDLGLSVEEILKEENALHLALKTCHTETIELSLEDINPLRLIEEDHEGKTPFDLAHKCGWPDIIKLIEDKIFNVYGSKYLVKLKEIQELQKLENKMNKLKNSIDTIEKEIGFIRNNI